MCGWSSANNCCMYNTTPSKTEAPFKDVAEATQWLAETGLTLPIILKPASASQHDLLFVRSAAVLVEATAPFVVEQFVPHGGIMYKVVVAGEEVHLSQRGSLMDDGTPTAAAPAAADDAAAIGIGRVSKSLAPPQLQGEAR